MNKLMSFTVALIVVCVAAIRIEAQEENSPVASRTSVASPTVDEAASDAPSKPRTVLRLPKYFAAIVSDVQRREINEIQRGYIERVKALQEQLDALKKEELAAIEQILSEPQLAQLEEMRLNGLQRQKPTSQPAMPADAKKSAKSEVTQSGVAVADRSSTKSRARAKGGSKTVDPTNAEID